MVGSTKTDSNYIKAETARSWIARWYFYVSMCGLGMYQPAEWVFIEGRYPAAEWFCVKRVIGWVSFFLDGFLDSLVNQVNRLGTKSFILDF